MFSSEVMHGCTITYYCKTNIIYIMPDSDQQLLETYVQHLQNNMHMTCKINSITYKIVRIAIF